MTKIQLKVLFKKMQKDNKKEVLMFHVVSDELPHADELLKLPGTIVFINLGGTEAKVGAEFVSIQRDNKKTVLKFNVKQNGKVNVNELYPFAGENVEITIEPSQMSIDEFYEEPREGIEYNVNPDGTTDVPNGQLSIVEDGAVSNG